MFLPRFLSSLQSVTSLDQGRRRSLLGYCPYKGPIAALCQWTGFLQEGSGWRHYRISIAPGHDWVDKLGTNAKSRVNFEVFCRSWWRNVNISNSWYAVVLPTKPQEFLICSIYVLLPNSRSSLSILNRSVFSFKLLIWHESNALISDILVDLVISVFVRTIEDRWRHEVLL